MDVENRRASIFGVGALQWRSWGKFTTEGLAAVAMFLFFFFFFCATQLNVHFYGLLQRY